LQLLGVGRRRGWWGLIRLGWLLVGWWRREWLADDGGLR
jgi:hypothetical protein